MQVNYINIKHESVQLSSKAGGYKVTIASYFLNKLGFKVY